METSVYFEFPFHGTTLFIRFCDNNKIEVESVSYRSMGASVYNYVEFGKTLAKVDMYFTKEPGKNWECTSNCNKRPSDSGYSTLPDTVKAKLNHMVPIAINEVMKTTAAKSWLWANIEQTADYREASLDDDIKRAYEKVKELEENKRVMLNNHASLYNQYLKMLS